MKSQISTRHLLLSCVLVAACGRSGPRTVSPRQEAPGPASPVEQPGQSAPAAEAYVAAVPEVPREVPLRRNSCAGAEAPAEASLGVRLDTLPYRTVAGQTLRLDLARPPAADVPPLTVVLVHGGGWRAGERAHLRDEMVFLAQQGIAAASLDYRLRQDGLFPAAVSDVRCALRYVAEQAHALGLDRRRIVAMGFSAGGHLAALAALASADERLDDVACPHSPTEVAGVIAYFAPFDFTAVETWPRASRRLVEQFLGLTVTDPRFASLATLASPLHQVTEDAPPMVLVHGQADAVVPISESEAMVAALEAVDVPVRFVDLPGEGHGFRFTSQKYEHRPAMCTVLAFLEGLRR